MGQKVLLFALVVAPVQHATQVARTFAAQRRVFNQLHYVHQLDATINTSKIGVLAQMRVTIAVGPNALGAQWIHVLGYYSKAEVIQVTNVVPGKIQVQVAVFFFLLLSVSYLCVICLHSSVKCVVIHLYIIQLYNYYYTIHNRSIYFETVGELCKHETTNFGETTIIRNRVAVSQN